MTVSPMERTSVPEVYRRGSRFVAVYRSDGRQRKQTAATLVDARAIKLAHDDAARALRPAPSWMPTRWADLTATPASGRDSGRENRRREYRRLLETFALRRFDRGAHVRDPG